MIAVRFALLYDSAESRRFANIFVFLRTVFVLEVAKFGGKIYGVTRNIGIRYWVLRLSH